MKMLPVALVCSIALVATAGRTAEAPSAGDGRKLAPVRQTNVRVNGFWRNEYRKLTVKWLPHCIRQMEKGGRGEELLNLVATAEINAGKAPSVKFKGCPWSDAYPYNTVEAACLALEINPGDDLEWRRAQQFLRDKIEEWIPIFLAAQEPSGYIHSYHALRHQKHFTSYSDHEFYVMGYFIEMGVAHLRLTEGRDRRLFDAARRCADHLDSIFGPAPKRTWMNGHPGLEMALLRLADEVNAREGAGKGDRYARLAQFFVRHQHLGGVTSSYNQSERPAWEMSEATGHAVRACYFYTAMTGIGSRLGDAPLAAAARRLFANAIDRKEYITGGVGASWSGEAFGPDWELRQNGYCESCAECGMAFWCDELHAAEANEKPEDVRERLIYNALLGSISADGEKFYYQNPLESDKMRYPWHGCPCCVGNIPRTLFALKDRLFSVSRDGKTLYIDQFMDMESADFRMETAYPEDGRVKVTLKRGGFDRVLVRFPNRAESPLYRVAPELAHGYRAFKPAATIEFDLPLVEQRVTAIDRVAACRGLVAYQRGPIVYSWEGDFGETKVANFHRLNQPRKSRVWIPQGDEADDVRIRVELDGQAALPEGTRARASGSLTVYGALREAKTLMGYATPGAAPFTPGYLAWRLFSDNPARPLPSTCVGGVPRRHGKVALHTWNTAAEFRDVRVTSPDGKVLWQGLPDPAKCEKGAAGRWTIEGDVLRQSNPKASDTALHFGGDWEACTVSFKFRRIGGVEGVIVWVLSDGHQRYVRANLGGWSNKVHSFEVSGGYRADLAHYPGSFETGRWYDIAVTYANGRMTATVDGRPAIATNVSYRTDEGVYSLCGIDERTDELVVKVVNEAQQPRSVRLAFSRPLPAAPVTLVSMSGMREDTACTPRRRTAAFAGGAEWALEVPSSSFTVLRMKLH